MNLAEPILKLFRKKTVPNIETGDVVRVHQKIKEGGKERIQVFEGIVIARHRRGDLDTTFTVRKIASGVGVEKVFLLHSPSITKIEFTKGSSVRRSKLYYLRGLAGKALKMKDKQGALKDSWEFVAPPEEAQTEASEEDIAEAVAADQAKKEEEAGAKAEVREEASPRADGADAKSGKVEEGGGSALPPTEVKDDTQTEGGANTEDQPAQSGGRETDQKPGQ